MAENAMSHPDTKSEAAPVSVGMRGGNAVLIEKTVILVLFVLLVAGVLLILRPFTVGLLFGAIIAVAAWPIRARLTRWGLSSSKAAFLMLFALLAFVLVPVAVAAPGLAYDVKALGERAVLWLGSSPQLPAWVGGIPLIGNPISDQWRRMFEGGHQMRETIATYAKPVRQFFTQAAVRRQNIWRRSRRKLAEHRPRLWIDVKRRSCGAASADVRWFAV